MGGGRISSQNRPAGASKGSSSGDSQGRGPGVPSPLPGEERESKGGPENIESGQKVKGSKGCSPYPINAKPQPSFQQ